MDTFGKWGHGPLAPPVPPPLHICLTRPRRFVTFYISALEILLLTYLLTYFLRELSHPYIVRSL